MSGILWENRQRQIVALMLAPDDVRQLLHLASAGTVVEPSDNGMADLETYYPFVRHMRLSERT